MNMRSRARNGNIGPDEQEGWGDHPHREESIQGVDQPEKRHNSDVQNEQTSMQGEQEQEGFGVPPPPPIIQLMHEALCQMIRDASVEAI